MADFPLFSPIPWASAINPSERYPSPPSLDGQTTYPVVNGVNGRIPTSHENDVDTVYVDDSSPQLNTGHPPPIDTVDIGLVPEDVARAAQEGGPPPRTPEEAHVPLQN